MATVWKSAASEKTFSTSATWSELDLSTDSDWSSDMGAVIYLIMYDAGATAFCEAGLRPTGSTDSSVLKDPHATSGGCAHICPIDGDGTCEYYTEDTSDISSCWVLGFIPSADLNSTGITNAEEISSGISDATWTNCAPDSLGGQTPVALFGFIARDGSNAEGEMRHPDSTDDFTLNDISRSTGWCMGCDTSGNVECYRVSNNTEIYIYGFLVGDDYHIEVNGQTTNISPTSQSTWQSKALPGDAPTGLIGGLVNNTTAASEVAIGCRKPGDTGYTTYNTLEDITSIGGAANGSGEIEVYRANSMSQFYAYVTTLSGHVLPIGPGDTTSSNGTSDPASVSHPAYSIGDLIILCIGTGGNTVTHTSVTAPDSETVTLHANQKNNDTTGEVSSVYYYIATANETSGTISVDLSASDDWIATVVVVPAGLFDATKPLSTAKDTAYVAAGGDITTGGFTANADDTEGRLLTFVMWDTSGAFEARPSGHSNLSSGTSDPYWVLDIRGDAVTENESIPGEKWEWINAADANSIQFIVRAADQLAYQYAYPTSDITDGSWVLSTTDAAGALYTMLDETTASDTDFIYVESNSTAEVKFGTFNAPDTSEEVKVSYRYRAAAGANNVTVSLWRGTTQVTSASWAHTSVGATYVQADQVLTTSQKNEISTNSAWSDLRLRFVSSGF